MRKLLCAVLAVLLLGGCEKLLRKKGDRGGNPTAVATGTIATVVEEIAMPHTGPFGAEVTPDGTKLFVPLFGTYGSEGPGSTVAVIDMATDAVVGEIKVGLRPEDVDFTEDGAYAYVTNSEDATVSVIHVPTLSVVETIPLGKPQATYLFGVRVQKGKGYVFSAGGDLDGSDENIFVIDTDPASATFNKKVSGITSSGVFSRGDFRTKELVVPRGSAGNDWTATPEIAFFSTETHSYLTSIKILQAPGGFHGIEDLAVTPNGKYAYAPFFNFDSGDAEVFVLDLANRTFKDLIRLDTGDIATHGVAMRSDGLLVGVTSWNVGKVSWIFTPTNTVVLEHKVGKNPNEIAFTPDGRKAYVTNQNSHTVRVISLPSSADLVIQLVQEAKASAEAAADLSWRIAKLKESLAQGTSAEVQVWLDSVVMKIRSWSDAGQLTVGKPKDLQAPGAALNKFKVLQGGVLAAIE